MTRVFRSGHQHVGINKILRIQDCMCIDMDFSLVIIIIITELAFSGYGREARYPAFATFSRPQKTLWDSDA